MTMYEESTKAIQTIKRAWQEGYTIVPMLGAGVSVDAGMPLVDPIIRYLVMIRKYVELAKYRPAYDAEKYKDTDKQYQQQPITYIRDYGWPDRFQLRQDLLLAYKEIKQQQNMSFEDWIREGLDNEPSIQKSRREALDKLLVANCKLGDKWRILGDWRAVIQDFTEFSSDDADALFEKLYRSHKPGRAHLFWALLTRLMGLRLFLTTNFDNFLERALMQQHIDHRVFGVEHGEHLPHKSLVRENVSVIKLHGDTHRLLVDEKLDYPPSKDYLERLQGCMPKRAIMLVMGYGGGDPRILKIVADHGTPKGMSKKADDGRPCDQECHPKVIWLHFNKCGKDILKEELKSSILHARVTDPGMFLSHLYMTLRGQNPASSVPYQTHIAQPLASLPDTSTGPSSEKRVTEKRVTVFRGDKNDASAAQRLAAFVLSKKTEENYTPIWVNLEAHYSVAGVVQMIVDQCRNYDILAAPFDIPPEPDHSLTVSRLLHVLRRGRYVVAFEAVEAFSWPPISHHGQPSRAQTENIRKKVDSLYSFLGELTRTVVGHEDVSDILICISCDLQKNRYEEHTRNSATIELPSLAEWRTSPQSVFLDEGAPGTATIADLSACDKSDHALFVVSCFRRPRSLVSLQKVFTEVFGDNASSEIDRLVSRKKITPIEGGFFSMRRSLRDLVFQSHSESLHAEAVKNLRTAAKGELSDELRIAIERCYHLASTQGFIARSYYTDSFLHSLDPWVFIEYFYHRVSSIRYATKLVCMLEGLDIEGCVRLQTSPPQCGKKDRQASHSFSDVKTHVECERKMLLQSLNYAFVQARGILLHGLPAAHLEAWCLAVLSRIYDWSDSPPSGDADSCDALRQCRMIVTFYDETMKEGDKECDAARAIFSTLLTLLRKARYEQGKSSDAAETAKAQMRFLGGEIYNVIFDGQGVPVGRHIKQCDRDSSLASVLDALAPPGNPADVDARRDKIKRIEKYYNDNKLLTVQGSQNQVRVACLLAEEKVRCKEERFDWCLCQTIDKNVLARNATIDTALDLVRTLSPDGALDSSHDPYYFRFRARLKTAKARLQWVGTARNNESTPDPHESFAESDRLLEEARASISGDDHARLARVELTWAEGLLLQANVRFKKQSSRADRIASDLLRKERTRLIDSARNDYTRAGDALQRARDLLTRGSRDVERWSCYYRLWSQYQAECCLFYLAEFDHAYTHGEDKNRAKKEINARAPQATAEILRRLRRGLGGLQAGIAIKPDGHENMWLQRTWLELLCAGVLYGRAMTEIVKTTGSIIDALWSHWVLMNKRAGIPVTLPRDSKYHRWLYGLQGCLQMNDVEECVREQGGDSRSAALKMADDIFRRALSGSAAMSPA